MFIPARAQIFQGFFNNQASNTIIREFSQQNIFKQRTFSKDIKKKKKPNKQTKQKERESANLEQEGVAAAAAA